MASICDVGHSHHHLFIFFCSNYFPIGSSSYSIRVCWWHVKMIKFLRIKFPIRFPCLISGFNQIRKFYIEFKFTTFVMLKAADRLNFASVPLWYVARACCSQSLIACLIIKRGDDSTIIFDADILEICEVLAGELSSSNLSELVRRGTSEWITLLRIQCDRDTITGPRLQ